MALSKMRRETRVAREPKRHRKYDVVKGVFDRKDPPKPPKLKRVILAKARKMKPREFL